MSRSEAKSWYDPQEGESLSRYVSSGDAKNAVDVVYDDMQVSGGYSGNGDPENIVIADPGSTYINKTATLGDFEYIKKTGSGNTGWIPSENCDTGLRKVDAINGWTDDGVYLRRIGSVVYLTVNIANATLASEAIFLIAPTGFKGYLTNGEQVADPIWLGSWHSPATESYLGFMVWGNPLNGAFSLTGFDQDLLTVDDSNSMSGSYVCEDAWPTYLPGIAV